MATKRKAESDGVDADRRAPAERASDQTASWTVLHTSEIAVEIFSYLVRERIDLLTISKLSKALRAIVLPLLVRELDVPLKKAPSCVHFFEAHPYLTNSVEFMRIRDDEAVRKVGLMPPRSFTQPPTTGGPTQTFPEYDSEEERDLRWFGIDRLLGVLLTHRAKQPPPLMDITIGITGISVFKATMRRLPQLLQRIAALRVICDLDQLNRPIQPHMMHRFSQLAAKRWRQLGLMVADMFQTEGQPPALRLFHAEDAIYGNDSKWNITRESWDLLKEVLPTTVEDLAIRLNLDETYPHRNCTLLETDWPRLRKFSLKSRELGSVRADRIQEAIDQFLTRHQHLEDIWIDAHADIESIPIPQTFPNLKRCAMAKSDYADLAPFLARHYGTVTDLMVPDDDVDEPAPNLFPPVISANLEPDSLKLEVLRASPEIASAFVSKGARPRHYVMEDVRNDEELGFDQWLFTVNEAAEAVTCLNVMVTTLPGEDEYGSDVLQAEFLQGGDLPNLVELALRWAIPGTSDKAQDGRESICNTLANLEHEDSLRALWLEHPLAGPLPPDTILKLLWDDGIPPRLEYLTWYSSSVNVAQYYRIARISVIQPEILSDGSGGSRTGSVRKIRLERLPDMFRSWIDGNGVWHQSRHNLFDHSHSPPRLYR
ncbi:hypothetical protein A4X13_0g3082 [Tilletia indica]|uniref:Uncharacterized protein n=1 Tax=Tilletia indica TaxID=43049 RepID=A0A177TQ85_9BASI|nr:hypothetical protein A4X13_0g3082 [Tilletia indica]